MLSRDDLLVWVDLEMTGLDPETCAIVELALIITDRELNAIADPLNIAIWQPESVLDKMSPMFERCTLNRVWWKEFGHPRSRSKTQRRRRLRRLPTTVSSRPLHSAVTPSDKTDAFFLNTCRPSKNFLHYRSIDVSTVKELGQWWHGVRYNKPSEGKHTALHDIQQSIEELRFLRGSIFR